MNDDDVDDDMFGRNNNNNIPVRQTSSGNFVANNNYGQPPPAATSNNNEQNSNFQSSPSNPLNVSSNNNNNKSFQNGNNNNNFLDNSGRNSPSSAWNKSANTNNNNVSSVSAAAGASGAPQQQQPPNPNNETQSSINPPPSDEQITARLAELSTYQRHPAIFFCFVSLMCFVFSIASTATPAYTYDRGSATLTQNRGVMDLTLWTANWCIHSYSQAAGPTTCATAKMPFADSSNPWCSALSDRWRAMQAFSILVVLYSAVMLVFGVAAAFPTQELIKKYIWSFVVAKIESPTKFLLVLSFGFWFFVLILWSLIAGSFHVAPCDSTVTLRQRNRLVGVRTLKDSGFKLSSGFALALMMWFYLSASLIWLLFKHLNQQHQQQPPPPPQKPTPPTFEILNNNNVSQQQQEMQSVRSASRRNSSGNQMKMEHVPEL